MEELIQDVTRLIVQYRKKPDSKEWKADVAKAENERREKLVTALTEIRTKLEELL